VHSIPVVASYEQIHKPGIRYITLHFDHFRQFSGMPEPSCCWGDRQTSNVRVPREIIVVLVRIWGIGL